jgi:putative (di)nucleoside polyphosphate hydrolase
LDDVAGLVTIPDLPYRPCVGIMVINREGRVWIGQRIGADGRRADPGGNRWQMPQGGIDDGEDTRAAALRELAEETGMHTVEIIGECPDWLTYDLPAHLVGTAWGGRYRGQRQRWFAVRFHGADNEINIGSTASREAEFDDWRWVAVDEVLARIVPFKLDVYGQVVAAFRSLAVPLDAVVGAGSGEPRS